MDLTSVAAHDFVHIKEFDSTITPYHGNRCSVFIYCAVPCSGGPLPLEIANNLTLKEAEGVANVARLHLRHFWDYTSKMWGHK